VHWRWLSRATGKSRARQIYTDRQRRKATETAVWQTQRRLLEAADRVLPNSQSEADLLKETFALNGNFQTKVDVVPNGIDPELFEPAPAPNANFAANYGVRDFVLEVGRISPVKNQLGVIEALFDSTIPIVFVGQPAVEMPEYAEHCRVRAAERGNVIFIDRMPHEELPGIYALAAVHVLPSWRETPGLVSLEAAASGCAVVTTSIGSTRDYFGDMAWYCYSDDYAEIRRGVEAALQKPRPAKLRDHVLSNFTWQHAGEATLTAYHHALARVEQGMKTS
jgi:glycosyltransferase involved in cell wall biosynthesis